MDGTLCRPVFRCGKRLRRVSVVVGTLVRGYLFKGNGEFVRVEIALCALLRGAMCSCTKVPCVQSVVRNLVLSKSVDIEVHLEACSNVLHSPKPLKGGSPR